MGLIGQHKTQLLGTSKNRIWEDVSPGQRADIPNYSFRRDNKYQVTDSFRLQDPVPGGSSKSLAQLVYSESSKISSLLKQPSGRVERRKHSLVHPPGPAFRALVPLFKLSKWLHVYE